MALTLYLIIKHIEDRPGILPKMQILQENDKEKAIL